MTFKNKLFSLWLLGVIETKPGDGVHEAPIFRTLKKNVSLRVHWTRINQFSSTHNAAILPNWPFSSTHPGAKLHG